MNASSLFRETLAVITLEAVEKGTRYEVLARHKDEADRKKHEEMGFQGGGGTSLDQLVACVKMMKAQ